MAVEQDEAAAIRKLIEELAAQTNDPLFGPVFQHTITTFPGSSKSRVASEIGTQLYTEIGQTTLYLMLSHDAIEERLEWLRKD